MDNQPCKVKRNSLNKSDIDVKLEPMSNQASEDELRDKLEEPIETLLNHLGERDDRDNWWGYDTNVGTLEDEIENAIESLMRLIRTEKLKLLNEVIHQSTVNLKSAKAVAGWAELRKKQLESNL